jgi:lysophospholipase L1-like esterase
MARLVGNRPVAASVVIAGLVLAAAAASRAVAGDTASQRSGSSAAASIAALGDSTSTGFSTAGHFAEAPANSWVTGTNPAVRSIYLRLRELNPAIAGHVHNGAEPGSTMSALAGQAARVPHGTDLVTIEMGTNDACGAPDRTRPATFRAQFEAALRALKARVPRARVVVLSIFDLPAMWDAVKSLSAATFARNLCTSVESTDDRRILAREVRDLNQQLASVCARHPNCRYDGGVTYRLRWRRRDISTVDYFHPSLSGQRNIAAALWATGAFPPTKR